MSLGYVVAMGVGMLPLALLFDWFGVAIAWKSDFVILRVLFTIPGAVSTALTLIAWLYPFTYTVVYIGAFIRAWRHGLNAYRAKPSPRADH